MTERGPQELVQSGERQLRLGFDAARADDLHVRCPLACVLEEGRLADPRLAPKDEHAASGGSRSVEQRPDPRPLGVPPVEHRSIVRPDFVRRKRRWVRPQEK
jgi:hypothetical protein